jgi:glyceraldehyde 3-phosphate dehydrogenase/glyceraldehyde-3-phosphate dehydrogenase (NAD(P))
MLLDIVAVNDLAKIDDIAYLLRYDSVHGKLSDPVRVDGEFLCYQNHRIRYFSTSQISQLPWKEVGVDVAIEATGAATARPDAALHLTAGAHRVLIAAPSADADFTLVLGVNQHEFDPERHHVVSNASCTTNSLVPPLKVLLDEFGIEEVAVTTIHAYTSSQGIVDRAASIKHRGRAAAISIIPTTTGADRATVQVLPQLRDRISACSVRVPVPDGSLTDITARLTQRTTAAELNAALKAATSGSMSGIMEFSDEELVSADILGEPYSAIVHGLATQSIDQLVKLQVWYDNETGYACRCLDAVNDLAM